MKLFVVFNVGRCWAGRLCVVAVALHAAVVSAQTNLPPATATVPKQVWDYAAELGLTPAQRETLQQIRQEREAARAEVERASVTNTPPDVRRAAQLNLNQNLRRTSERIGQLLTDEQKKKFAELRGIARTRPEAAVSDSPADEAQLLVAARKPTRPVLSEDEYRQLAARLRAEYSQPSAQWPAPEIDDDAKPHFVELGLLPPAPFPTNNPYSDAKAELGRKLFFEPRLSGSGQIACASCHDADLAFTDGRTVSFGHERKELKRNAPTVLNVAFNRTLFWDGRAASLEQQASDVVKNQDEMHASETHVHERLGQVSGYTNDLIAAFGSPEFTLERAAQAIATFERTITSRNNDFDSFLRGATNALSDPAIRGLHLFRTTARCINCHNGPNFTDGRFHNEGLTYYGRKFEDLGRYKVTQRAEDVGRFKTPSLRNIARTGPYMHNGLFDLDGVLNMYNGGMPNVRPTRAQKDDPLFPQKSPLLKPLGLNKQEVADLKAFLESLTEGRMRLRPPALPGS